MLPLLLALTFRNTPTCVGKTFDTNPNRSGLEKHPHVRGEDVSTFSPAARHRETPPRAWGRPARQALLSSTRRNTPTCVGKTPAQRSRQSCHRKHPHVRGEDVVLAKDGGHTAETPPRAWGRPYQQHHGIRQPGNTPTCVGKTPCKHQKKRTKEKHPHVRGEDLLSLCVKELGVETPPRAWGRQPQRGG